MVSKRRDNYNSMTWDIDGFDEEGLNEDLSKRDDRILAIEQDIDWIQITISWIQTSITGIEDDITDIFDKFTAWYTWSFIVDWKTLTFSEWLLTSVI